jgi:hypothetical protein
VSPLGLCVAPGFIPSADELAELRPAFLRSILRNVVDDLEALLATGLPLLITLNNEADMVAGWSGWDEACSYIGQRAGRQLIGITAGNELDVFNARNADDVPPTFGADLVTRAQRALRPLGIPVGTTSLGGPNWVGYLTEMLRLCEPDFVALNPYGWIFDGLDTKIAAVRTVAPGRPIRFTELGCKINDAGGEDGVAHALHDVAAVVGSSGIDSSWFAWRDQVGAPDERGPSAFGLVAEDGRRRPAWDAFAAVNAIPAPAPTPGPVPTPEPEPEPTPAPALAPLDAAYAALWQAIDPTLVLNPESAFYKAWRANHREWGSPVSGEIPDADGSVLQTFANAGPMRWTGGDSVEAA